MCMINEDELKRNLSNNLRMLRESRRPRISQRMLAKKIGVAQKSISNYETRVTLPPLSVLMDIAKYFGVTADELLSAKFQCRKGRVEKE